MFNNKRMDLITEAFNTPWKVWNELSRPIWYPYIRLQFLLNGIPWGKGWRFYGAPVIQKHRQSTMRFGNRLTIRSIMRASPFGLNHPTFLSTFREGAVLEIGDDVGMMGAMVCAVERITIGNRVGMGLHAAIVDSDFHPLDAQERLERPNEGRTAPVVVEDDVFLGMNCLVMKGVTVGRGSVVAAHSVVVQDVPPATIVMGIPARVISPVKRVAN